MDTPSVGSLQVLLVACLGLLCLHISQTQACSCMPEHPQTSYCKADFVLKARVKHSKLVYREETSLDEDGNKVINKIPVERKFQLRISKVLKDSAAFQNVSQKYIYTGANGAMCGVELNNNTKYLIEGRVFAGKPRVGLCNHIVEWNKVPVRQRKGYNYMYEQNCNCKIQLCWTPKCQRKSHNKNTCKWNMPEDPGDCYGKHSMCRKSDGECLWARTGLWRTCMADVATKRQQEP